MAQICQVHPYEAAESLCRSCGGPFCADCLVYSFGPTKPPFCVPCAVTAGGVRRTARNPKVAVPKESRRQLKEWRKARKRDLEGPAPDGVATWQKMDEAEAEAEAVEDEFAAAEREAAERQALRLPEPPPEPVAPPPDVNVAPPGSSNWQDEIAEPLVTNFGPPGSSFDPEFSTDPDPDALGIGADEEMGSAPTEPAPVDPTAFGTEPLGGPPAGDAPPTAGDDPWTALEPVTPVTGPWSEPEPADPAAWSEPEPADPAAWSEPAAPAQAWTEAEPVAAAWADDAPLGATTPAWSEPEPAAASWVEPEPASPAGTEAEPVAATWADDAPGAPDHATDAPMGAGVFAGSGLAGQPLDALGAPMEPSGTAEPADPGPLPPPPPAAATGISRPPIRPPTPTRIPAAPGGRPKPGDAKAVLQRIAALRSDADHD